jgi:Ser/Thr protein kinase RdoA (MazF antagonist)
LTASDTPYRGLTPATILDALSAVGYDGDGRLLQLNSFENRVFQVMLDDGQAVVTKFYRPGRWRDEQILEEHAFTAEAAADGVPAVAPLPLHDTGRPALLTLASAVDGAPATLGTVVVDDETWRLAVWPRRAGRAPELEDASVLQRLGRTLAALHRCGEREAFAHRQTREPLADAQAAIAAIDASGQLPHGQAHAWHRAVEAALPAIAAVTGSWRPRTLRLHGDCHPGNLLTRNDQPNLVDFDDCASGPAVQDLWMLLSGDPTAAREQLDRLLEGYTQVRPFDDRERVLIPAWRLARLLRHNAWVAQRWHDPAFPAAYPDFGSPGYWAQQALQLQELADEAANPTAG